MKEVDTQNLWTFELGTEEKLIFLFGLSLVFINEIDKIHKI